jgi:hypothetical protein
MQIWLECRSFSLEISNKKIKKLLKEKTSMIFSFKTGLGSYVQMEGAVLAKM